MVATWCESRQQEQKTKTKTKITKKTVKGVMAESAIAIYCCIFRPQIPHLNSSNFLPRSGPLLHSLPELNFISSLHLEQSQTLIVFSPFVFLSLSLSPSH